MYAVGIKTATLNQKSAFIQIWLLPDRRQTFSFWMALFKNKGASRQSHQKT